MKKHVALLIAMALVVTFPAIAVQADDSGDASGPVSVVEVDSVAPEIEEASIVVQVINDGKTAWQWQDGEESGVRPVPYVLDEETLRVELDVTDANGTADLQGMKVEVTLGEGVQFACGLESTTIDPDARISRGHYAGDLTVDARVAQGKYDMAVMATDPSGAVGTHNPETYEPAVDILMRPTLGMEITSSSVTFPSARPGDRHVAAIENPIGVRPYAVIGNDHIPVVFSVSHLGRDMEGSTSSIPVDCLVWSLAGQADAAIAVSSDEQTVAGPVEEGETVQVYYWLNVPFPQESGTYSGRLTFRSVAD